jgi:hypothetical protein
MIDFPSFLHEYPMPDDTAAVEAAEVDGGQEA